MIDDSGRLIKVEDITAPRAIAPLFLFGNENRYPVEVTANEVTEVIEIPKASVLKLFRKNEKFLENYMNLSANYAHTLSDKLFFMSFKTIRQKLASYLLLLAYLLACEPVPVPVRGGILRSNHSIVAVSD